MFAFVAEESVNIKPVLMLAVRSNHRRQ